MQLPSKWYQFLIGVFASLGSLLFGYDLGVIAQVIAPGGNVMTVWNPASNDVGMVVSLFTAGAFCGAGLAGPPGDILGRRATIMIGAIVFCVGGIVQTSAQNMSGLYAGRFFAGMGCGFLTMMIPLYQSELSHPSIRGRVTALQQFMLGVGALLASWIIPGAILGALILLFPESPRWLIKHGKPEQGLRNLAKLHAYGNEQDPWVRAEFEQIQESIAYDEEHEAKSYKELFTSLPAFRRVLLCTALQASIQMTGVSAIQYYSTVIFAKIGISSAQTLRYQAINSVIALLGEFSCIMLIDHLGRRWPLILGNLGNMVTFIWATILLAKFPPSSGKGGDGAHWAFILSTWVYNFSFSATCGPLSWIIPAEVFDTKTRAKGISIATMTSFAFNTMIGQVTSPAMANVGYKYYYLFIVCNLTNAIFFWLFLPETSRLPLEEMNYLFTHSPWIIPGSKKTEYISHDLETRAAELSRKEATVSEAGVKAE
ncbi:general substrate transporter [Stipitochalara longipes BDJ]|nr:general substrate transporter [Stipitochalara longipes BDJ]